MLAGPLGKDKESSWLIRWGCPGVRQRPHGMMRLSFSGISGPGRVDEASLVSSSSPKVRPHRHRTPGGGIRLQETWPGHGLCVLHGSPPPVSGSARGPGSPFPPPPSGSVCICTVTFRYLFCHSCLVLPSPSGQKPLIRPPDSLCSHPRGKDSFFPIIGGETEGPVQ